MKKRMCFIGCGNMAQAIVGGLIRSGYDPKTITVTRRNENSLAELNSKYGVVTTISNTDACHDVSYIFLCVKPQQMEQVCNEIKPFVDQQAVLISIAAGVSIENLEDWLGKDKKIIRAMPNTPVMVQAGMTSISLNDEIKKDKYATEVTDVKALFESCGQCEIVSEDQIAAVIGVSGSAPAYIYMMIEALADGAVKEGLSRDLALTFASQTVLGSAKMVLETKEHPAQLKDKVASPGGTTIEAIASLEKNGFRGIVIEALSKAAQKSRNLK